MGSFPISESGILRAESAEAQKKKKKKKKSSGKKSSSKKKKSSGKKKKKGSKKSKKKKSSGKKKKSKKKESEKSEAKAEPIESASSINKTPRINTAAYADELFNLTGELQASNKELARATRYFYEDEPKKKVVALDSKPFFSRKDFEKEARP